VANALDNDVRLKALLERLHAESDAQTPALMAFVQDHGFRSVSGTDADVAKGRGFWADKMVALEPVKARFCYSLCRALNAKRIVECGTSFGVSTLYLAAAVRDNGGGTVIATEYEPSKAAIAREHFEQAGLSQFVDLREGDLRETLKRIERPVDFLLMDIWTPLARPAIELIGPHLRKGAIVVADNTDTYRIAYGDYFAYLNDPANGFSTMTLPFDGGLEMSVKTD
jgi:predicted O-methyltransferase YrrM